jgi:hypothetical protein
MQQICNCVRFLMAASGLLALGASAAHATIYNVGPNQPYTTLSSVPWASLAAGDTVNIHWQSQPYREMILICAQGTAAQPVTIQGVPDPTTGQLPIIDGENAVQSASLPYHDKNNPLSSQSLYELSPVMVGPPLGNAYNNLPQYITIQNLIVRNANQNYSFTNYTGTTTQYPAFATAIYVEGAQHLTIRNCTLTGSGNGLFVNSKYGSTGVSSDILIENNSIYGNGNVGSETEHNVYTEANGIVFQYNTIGNLASGAGGDALKDRSAGTVIRYNCIGGGGHCIDLVETMGGQGYLDLQPSYRTSFVYGNVIANGSQGAADLIHYGGDQWNYTYYRRGTLYFYDNTVGTQANQRSNPQQPTDRWSTQVFELPSQGETGGASVQEIVDCRNSIFYSIPLTPGLAASALNMITTDGTGTLILNRNWLSPGTAQSAPIYDGTFIGTITGWASNLFGNSQGANDPGFVSVANLNPNLKPGSSCIGAGGALLPEEQGVYGVYYQYTGNQSNTLRLGNPAGPDIGAYGFGTPRAVPLYSLSGQVMSQGTGLGGVPVSTSTGVTTTTAADGTYRLTGLVPDFYSVAATLNNYLMSGPQTVALDASTTGINFTAQALYTLRGQVTCQGVGLGGVTVNVSNGATTTTAADGTYTIAGLVAGTYTVSVTDTGYTLGAAQTVQVTGNTSGVNFTGYSNTQPMELVSFTLNTYVTQSYCWPTATITLNQPPNCAGGYVPVTMTSSDPSVVLVYDFQIWSPNSSGSVSVVPLGVNVPTDVTITVTCCGVSQSVVLTVIPYE